MSSSRLAGRRIRLSIPARSGPRQQARLPVCLDAAAASGFSGPMIRLPALLSALILALALPAAAEPAWVEMTGQGAEARTVAAGADGCPSASIDGRPAAMTRRAGATPEFPA